MKNFRSVAGRLLPVILLFALPLSAQSGVAGLDGSWDAVVVVGQAEIPFRFEISPRGAGPQGFSSKARIGSDRLRENSPMGNCNWTTSF